MKNGPEISNAHVWDPTEAFWKKNLSFWKFYGTLILKKRLFRDFFKEKKPLPPQKMTDFDKISTGDISHYGLPSCKISSKLEHLKYQKLPSKIQNSGKKNPKIVFGPETLPWYGRHLWTMGQNSFRGLLVMPKKNLVALRAFFGWQITI